MSRTALAASPFAGGAEIRRDASRLVLSAAWSVLAGLAKRMLARRLERRRESRAILELSALSDRMLKDIGIDRGSIPRIARYGRD